MSRKYRRTRRLLLRLLLYGYCTGVVSSRAIERKTQEDVAFRYLAANQHPDHDTIAAFRQPLRKNPGQLRSVESPSCRVSM